MLVRLLYASRVVDASPALFDAILNESRARNLSQGITGVLCYGNGAFLQVLEGARPAVSHLYNRIQRDARHTHIELLRFEEITERRFACWSMGQVNLSKLNNSIILKYSASHAFDPFSVSSQVSLALLEELTATAAVISRS